MRPSLPYSIVCSLYNLPIIIIIVKKVLDNELDVMQFYYCCCPHLDLIKIILSFYSNFTRITLNVRVENVDKP